MTLTRRSFIAGAAMLGAPFGFVRSLRAADYRFTQLHNQTTSSSLHQRLVEMWAAVRAETNGRVETEVFAENNNIRGSDPAALQKLVNGDIHFFTLMGGILGNVVPAADVQQVPFAFGSAAVAFRAMDGALGTYVRDEMAARGIVGLRLGAFDNGMRHIACATRPIATPSDLAGMKIRIPAGRMFNETFSALGAEPITVNVDGIYGALKSGAVAAQENPLAVVGLFKLYEVVRYVSLTNHMWSGFNLLANRSVWTRLPADIRDVIERNTAKYVRLQRKDQDALNARWRMELATRGLTFNNVDRAPFRRALSGVYARWKERLGTKCWLLLEAHAGRLV